MSFYIHTCLQAAGMEDSVEKRRVYQFIVTLSIALG
jgi:hypothetical protein